MINLRTNAELTPVNLGTVEMKHFGAKWLVKLFEHISNNPHLLVNGFVSAGITNSIREALKDCEDFNEQYDLSSANEDCDNDAVFSD